MRNKYEQFYKDMEIKISEATTQLEAQKIVTQLGLMYNALGTAIKDIIRLLNFKFLMANPTSNLKSPNIVSSTSLNKNSYQRSQIQKVIYKKPSQTKEVAFNEKMKINEEQDISSDEKETSISKNEVQKDGFLKNYQFTSENIEKNRGNQNSKIERKIGVRNKEDRQTLNGYSCADCDKFYSAIQDQEGEGSKRCDCISRHRSNLPPTRYFLDFTQQFGFDD